MSDTHSDTRPANLDHVEAQAGRNSPRFWWMFVVSTALIVVSVIVVFAATAG